MSESGKADKLAEVDTASHTENMAFKNSEQIILQDMQHALNIAGAPQKGTHFNDKISF